MLKRHIDNTLVNLLVLQSAFGAGSYKSFQIYNILSEQNSINTNINKINWKNIDESDIERIMSVNLSTIKKIIEDCEKNDIQILTICDEEFPDRFRNISEPPLVLYIKGNFPKIDEMPIITIVGPRNSSSYGEKAAFSLARRFALAGMIIVSGGAKGIDSFAHKGALAAQGKTIAVLPCGICYDYLPENRKMRKTIAETCCLISEHPPYAKTTKYCYLVRNRLMSALSLGTIVVEAGEKSGALNTAKHAYEQGRDVFVIPGKPTEKCYIGSNKLLRDGALPLIDTSDVFNQYIVQYADKIDLGRVFEDKKAKSDKKNSKKIPIGLSKEAEMVYNSLNKQKFTADDLLSLGLSDEKIISALTELEMEMLIKAIPGGIYEILT